jgi:hypothetical protein
MKLSICLNNALRTGDFKHTTLTCALFTLKTNIKSRNLFYELKFLGNAKAPRSARECDISGNIPVCGVALGRTCRCTTCLPISFVNCANTALPSRILILAMFTLHTFCEDIFAYFYPCGIVTITSFGAIFTFTPSLSLPLAVWLSLKMSSGTSDKLSEYRSLIISSSWRDSWYRLSRCAMVK